MQSKKLKKKNAADKAEKKKISKQIKELKSLIRRAGEDVSSGSDSDWFMHIMTKPSHIN